MKRFFSVKTYRVFRGAAIVFLMLSQLAWISIPDQTDPLRMGVYENPPLSSFIDGKAQGFVIDLIEAVAVEEGWQVAYVPCQWAQCLEMLAASEIDILGPIAYSEERADRFAFSEQTYFTNWGVIYAQPGHEIETFIDLREKNLAVLEGDIYTDALVDLLDRFDIQPEHLLQLEDYSAVLGAVEAGEAQAGLVNRLFGTLYDSTYNVAETPIIFHPVEVRFAMAHGSDEAILSTIDGYLADWKNIDGSPYDQAIDRWLPASNAMQMPTWMRWVPGLLAGGVGLFFSTSLLLRWQVKKRTRELRASENRNRALLESIPDLMFLVNREGVFLDYQASADRKLHVPPDQFLGKKVSEVLPLELAETTLQNVQRALDANEIFTHGYQLPKNGEKRDFEARYIPNSTGEVLTIVREVTERKRAMRALGESEEKYRTLVERANDGVAIIQRGVVRFVNPRLAHMRGEPQEKILGHRLTNYIHPDERARVFDMYRRAAAGEEVPSIFETVLERVDGGQVIAELSTGNVVFEGKPAILAIVRDITERKRTEDALEESRASLLLILDSIEADVYVSDMHTYEILFMNQHMRASFDGDLVGKVCWQVFRDETKPCPHCTNSQLLDSEGNPAGIVAWEGRNPITGRWYVNNDQAIKWVDGRLVRLQIATDISAFKRTEAALRESEERYRLVSDLTSDYAYAYRVDGDGNLVNEWVTGAFERITGYAQHELQSLGGWDKLIHEQDLHIPTAQLKALLEGREKTVEYRIRTEDGQIRWMLDYARPMWDEKLERTTFIYGAVQDITERKEAEEALKASERRFRTLVEQSPFGIQVFDAEGILVQANKSWEEIWGVQVDQIIGKFNALQDPQIGAAGLLPIIERAFAGESVSIPDTFYDPTASGFPGRKQWIRTHAYPVKDRDGHVVNVVVINQDVSEQKKVERALRESEAQYRTLFEHANDAIFLENESDEIIDVNHQACELMGYTREELLQMTVPELQAPEVRGKKGTVLKQELEKYCGELFESINLHRDGTRIPVEISTASLLGVNKGLVLAIVRDITERKRIEDQIRENANRVEALLEVEKAITSTLDLDEVLEIIMTEMGKIIPYDSISLQLLHDDFLKVLACRGFDQPEDVLELHFPLDPKFPNERVIKSKKAVAIEDVAKEYPHFQDQSSQYKSGHIRSWLGIPLISKGKVDGMIALDRSEVKPFSRAEIQMGTAIASQAALAVENASLFSDAQLRLERLSSLRRIDQTISSSLDLRMTLGILIGQVLQQLKVDAAAVLLYRPEIQSLQFIAGQGFRTQALQFTDLRLGEGFAGRAALDQRTVKVTDLTAVHTGFLRSPEFRNEGFISYIGVPLIAKGNIIGVLEIYHRQPLEPDSEWMVFLETLAGQAAIAIDNIRLFEELQYSNIQLRQAYDATIRGWAQALELREMETKGQNHRAVDLTQALARKMGIEDKKLTHIRWGVLLHDIGKMGVPDTILQKPGRLTEAEWESMRQHPTLAHEWLAPISYLRSALDIPYYHHEKWDGSGYPQGLKGEQIPLTARIFAVVDVWDALLSDRPYRKAWTQEKALAYLRKQAGQHFDPRVVDAFIEMLFEEGYLP